MTFQIDLFPLYHHKISIILPVDMVHDEVFGAKKHAPNMESRAGNPVLPSKVSLLNSILSVSIQQPGILFHQGHSNCMACPMYDSSVFTLIREWW